MRIIILIIYLFFGHLITVISQPGYWQQQVNYNIDVTLNDQEHTLTGFERMEYLNNSPDTLTYIYIHLWPNAYKNDRTAFSEQLLKNGRTAFYFSDEDERGYINQLEFKVNEVTATVEEDAEHIDIILLKLPEPLAPKQAAVITTPFHVKLPYNFSRCGHIEQSYQITQWYPKAAVYDKDGWHPIPYLDQGEYYNDFGNYTISISLPDNYTVAATGVLQNMEEGITITQKAESYLGKVTKKQKTVLQKNQKESEIPSSTKQKTLSYSAENVSDFAWFADKSFIVKKDTIQLNTHMVEASCYILPESAELYKNSISFIKKAIRFYSNQLGEYPFPTVNVVCSPVEGPPGGMEYPMITIINEGTETALDVTIAHEIGHNWLMGILSSNERDHPWMDEGMNAYFEKKYSRFYYPGENSRKTRSFNLDFNNDASTETFLQTIIALYKNQPIDTTSELYSETNYGAIVYYKTGLWMEKLEQTVGTETMQRIMRQYFKAYAFKHPSPDDFKKIAQQISNQNLSSIFSTLHETGLFNSNQRQSPTQVKLILPPLNAAYNYITIAPLAGYNNYDGVMIGGVIHNYQLPLKKIQFLVVPMYATTSSGLTGAARISYNKFTKKSWLEISGSAVTYSINDYIQEAGSKSYLRMSRFVPSLKLALYNKDLREKDKWMFQLRSFLLNEDRFRFTTVTTPTDTFNVIDKSPVSSVINQLKVTYQNNRTLYPYNANITIDQGKDFLRAGFTANYFFNYNEKNEGLNTRFFAGKFFYLIAKTFIAAYNTDRYHLNMSGPKGDEDYTYSGYYIGRNEFEGWKSQQILERDGFFKVRTDLLGNKVGKTDDWLIAVNVSGDIPEKVNPLNVLPFKLPVKFFVDIGTYSDAWRDNPATGRFLYDAGLQLSFLKSGINIYFPLLYSKVYSDYFKSTLGASRFWKTVSFNINLSILQPSKLFPFLP